jgi:four helix bundle suffix protein
MGAHCTGNPAVMNFGGTSGYFWLDSWILANVVQLGTQRYCQRFLNRRNDPCGRQYDQMTQAARSGCANIAEGSARRKTSSETEMRLTDVARASLAELAGDLLNALLQHDRPPWPKDSEASRAVYAVRLDKADYGQDVVHDASRHILRQKAKFAIWLDAAEEETVANALLILIARIINMLNHQLEAQGDQFRRDGGFREQLTRSRMEARAEADQGPRCPDCGKPMLRRHARAGRNAGRDFWGCSGYPDCRGTREVG